MKSSLLKVGFFCLLISQVSSAQSVQSLHDPIPSELLLPKLRPGFHRPDLAQVSERERGKALAAMRQGNLRTLPYWQGSFSIEGADYHYTIVGGDPATGGETDIKTVIVPIKLTVSDYSVDGKRPLVFDATPMVPRIVESPIFQVSSYITGYQQFADAMLRAEFPGASDDWHTVLKSEVASTVEITIEPGGARVYRAESGALFANILDDHPIDKTILRMLQKGVFGPDEYPVFVTYNATEHDAFGYHAAVFDRNQDRENVFAYTSWLENVDDLFTIPSPDAATMSHEVAETIHDGFIGDLASLTLLWGDPFRHNKCFQRYIEVGDAIEDAPARIQLHEQVVDFGHKARVYTLQNEAMLPWFERQTPSKALAGAYSFPDIWVLTSAAPEDCAH